MLIRSLMLCLFLQTTFISFCECAYLRPSYINEGLWKQLFPYFLPESHPMKELLDAFFSRDRLLLNAKSMRKAGFTSLTPQKVTRLIVTKHPKLKGYVIKTYLDAQKARKNKSEGYYWLLRIEGANAIRSLIEEKGWQSSFKVPHKWIYPLPAEPSPPRHFQRINFLLIEEDMDIFDNKTNEQLWGSSAVTSELLEKLFYIIETLGLKDCPKPDNIPFSQDGKVAFVDTQTHHEWPINYKKLEQWLAPTMKSFWKERIREGIK